MASFTVLLQYDPDHHAYTATVPALPGCVTEGDTVQETLDMARDAIEGYLESMIEDGEEVLLEEPRLIVASVDVRVPSLAGAAVR